MTYKTLPWWRLVQGKFHRWDWERRYSPSLSVPAPVWRVLACHASPGAAVRPPFPPPPAASPARLFSLLPASLRPSGFVPQGTALPGALGQWQNLAQYKVWIKLFRLNWSKKVFIVFFCICPFINHCNYIRGYFI